jgi:uncharacterized protein
MQHEMKVFGFAHDPLTQRPLVLLKGERGEPTVPLWLSSLEAVSLAAELAGREAAAQRGREDLLSLLLKRLGMKPVSITIGCRADRTITAEVRFTTLDEELVVAVRTSEALAASLRFKLPLLVSDEVVELASVSMVGDELVIRDSESGRLADFLERLDPAELGKYPM